MRASFTLFLLSLVVCLLNSGKQFSIYLLVDHRIDLGQMLLTPLKCFFLNGLLLSMIMKIELLMKLRGFSNMIPFLKFKFLSLDL